MLRKSGVTLKTLLLDASTPSSPLSIVWSIQVWGMLCDPDRLLWPQRGGAEVQLLAVLSRPGTSAAGARPDTQRQDL